MIVNCLCFDLSDLDFFTVSSILVLWNHRRGLSTPIFTVSSGLATPIFSLSSLEPKSLRMVILTIILIQVLCCLYQSPKHYIEIWLERPFSLQTRGVRARRGLPAVGGAKRRCSVQAPFQTTVRSDEAPRRTSCASAPTPSTSSATSLSWTPRPHTSLLPTLALPRVRCRLRGHLLPPQLLDGSCQMRAARRAAAGVARPADGS